MNTSTHIIYIYMPIAYRYMLTVHLMKMFQNKRTRNSYTIFIEVEGQNISYNNYNRGKKTAFGIFD